MAEKRNNGVCDIIFNIQHLREDSCVIIVAIIIIRNMSKTIANGVIM